VFETMAHQAELDMNVEEAKMMLSSSCTLESAFATLTSPSVGFVTLRGLRALMEDCGKSLSTSEFVGIVREVRLRWSWDDPAAGALLIQERLSLRDLGLLVCRVGTPEYKAVRDAKNDDEVRSELYMLKYTEPCPRCAARVQRDRDAAGCPTVTCPVCATRFQCFCVVGDPTPGYYNRHGEPELLSPAMCYQVADLFSTVIKANFALEMDRKKLSLLTQYDTCSLTEVFGHIAGSHATFNINDLRYTMAKHGGPFVSERGLDLLWRRYCSRNSGPQVVGLPDFRRQLHPTCLSP